MTSFGALQAYRHMCCHVPPLQSSNVAPSPQPRNSAAGRFRLFDYVPGGMVDISQGGLPLVS